MRLPELGEIRQLTVAGVLADIAHELSSIQGWDNRVQNTLSLLCDMYPASEVILGTRVEGWRTFYCEEPSDLLGMQSLLLHHYSILTGETPPVFIDSGRIGHGELTPIDGVVVESGSFITMPVIGADQTLGVLHISTDDPDAYSLEDVSIISIVASQIGAFLRNVLAFATEVKNREEIERLKSRTEHQLVQLQRALVPAEPSIVEGYALASLYIPGMKGQEIGGDFFDVFETEEKKVGILIGDVAGKGIEAASLAAAARSTVRAFAYESSSPSEALNHSNTVLTAEPMGISQFVTMSLIVLDPESGDIRYASGGHPPAVLYHTDGSTELLSRRNMPVGVFQGEEYTEGSANLAPGDKLILFTDGITEARRGNDMLGAQGVERIVRAHETADPQTLVDSILSTAKEWQQDRLPDDIAIIVVERHRLGESGK